MQTHHSMRVLLKCYDREEKEEMKVRLRGERERESEEEEEEGVCGITHQTL